MQFIQSRIIHFLVFNKESIRMNYFIQMHRGDGIYNGKIRSAGFLLIVIEDLLRENELPKSL